MLLRRPHAANIAEGHESGQLHAVNGEAATVPLCRTTLDESPEAVAVLDESRARATTAEQGVHTDVFYVFDDGCLCVGRHCLQKIRRRRVPGVVLPLERDARRTDHNGGWSIGWPVSAVRPLAPFILGGTGFACTLMLFPSHRDFRAFRSIPPGAGYRALDRSAFVAHECAIVAVYAGTSKPEEARRLFDQLAAAAVRQLPPEGPLDGRIAKVLDVLRRRPDHSLQDLAREVHLSYFRLSHLFATNVGVPLRSYRSALMAATATKLLAQGHAPVPVAERARFYDVRHLNRICVEEHGVPPSSFLRGGIRVFTYGLDYRA